jgi:hypothetical protein
MKAEDEGLVYPKCPGCGHNYFELKPVPPDPNGLHGKYPNGGLCIWCIEEQNEKNQRSS